MFELWKIIHDHYIVIGFTSSDEFSDVNKIWSLAKGSSMLLIHIFLTMMTFLVTYDLWR